MCLASADIGLFDGRKEAGNLPGAYLGVVKVSVFERNLNVAECPFNLVHIKYCYGYAGKRSIILYGTSEVADCRFGEPVECRLILSQFLTGDCGVIADYGIIVGIFGQGCKHYNSGISCIRIISVVDMVKHYGITAQKTAFSGIVDNLSPVLPCLCLETFLNFCRRIKFAVVLTETLHRIPILELETRVKGTRIDIFEDAVGFHKHSCRSKQHSFIQLDLTDAFLVS